MPAAARTSLAYLPPTRLLLCSAAAILVTLVYPLHAQPQLSHPSAAAPAAPTSPDAAKIDAMIRTLLSETVDLSLRQAQARVLLQDPQQTRQAHQALLEIINSDSNGPTAKIIICQAIATGPSQLLNFSDAPSLAPAFTDALCKCLLSDNPDLSRWAAQALAKCHDGISQRLATMATDPKHPVNQRLAAVAALERMSGREPVLALSRLLTAPDTPTDLQNRAVAALVLMLNLPAPLSSPAFIKEFQAKHLPHIVALDEQTFLRWQFDALSEKLWSTQAALRLQQQRGDEWLRRFADRLTVEFNALSDPKARLDILRRYLADQNEDALRAWALDRIRDWTAVNALGGDSAADEIITLLTPCIADASARVRQSAANCLEQLAGRAQTAAPALLEQLTRESDPIAQAAQLAALRALEYTPAIDQALCLLASDQPAVVAQAARTLGRLAASPANPPSPDQVNTIAHALAVAYTNPAATGDIRTDLILAIRKIAAIPHYRDLARQTFDDLLVGALADSSEKVRSEAVSALTEIHGAQALPLLLQPHDLLADRDIVVRLAVINAIRKYPDARLLAALRQRLAQEDNPDVIREIDAAFLAILEAQPLKDVYAWASDLRNYCDRPEATRQEKLLFDRVTTLLADKIAQAKTANQPVPAEYEALVLHHQADAARRDGQPAQAVQHYQSLLSLDLPNAEKDEYRRALLAIGLGRPDDPALLALAGQALDQLLANPANLPALDSVAQTSDSLPDDDKRLLRSGRILAGIIVPVLKNIPPPQSGAWNQRLLDAKLQLIDAQEKLVAAESPAADPAENPVANSEPAALLAQLDPRLWDYPARDVPEKRLAALAQFRKTLTTAPNAAPPRPKPPAPRPASASPKPTSPREPNQPRANPVP